MADEALIEDTTTPEVLAQEAAVLAGTAPDAVEVPEAPAADAPAEPAATPTAQAVPTATENPPAPPSTSTRVWKHTSVPRSRGWPRRWARTKHAPLPALLNAFSKSVDTSRS